MKISFCTTCMDRLFHLNHTYLTSINNTFYNDKEFILLNYGSKKDNIDDWVYNNLSEFINIGLVSYYKTTEPEYWVAAHAKNISHKLATGDILVNLDCDNILVKNYCEYLASLFVDDVIVSSDPYDYYNNLGSCGLIASRKDHFYSVNGYDESFEIGWGMDDTNYQYRCRMKNNLKLIVQDKKYNLCVSHSNEVRTQNCRNKNIEFTKKNSEQNLYKIANEYDYVANKNIKWGSAKLIKNFNEFLEI